MIPHQIFEQISDKRSEGVALALADNADGAVMHFQWCDSAFSKITGYTREDILNQRGTILIGPKMEQGKHLLIIEKLMNWEQFTLTLLNSRKDGTPCWQQMRWTPLVDAKGGTRWWICSVMELESPPIDPVQPLPVAPHDAEPAKIAAQAQEIERLNRENARLYDLAQSVAIESNQDPLTGLSNRRHFEVELNVWISNLKARGVEFAVLYIDLDRFKFVNDTLGHDAGDTLLKSVAHMLRRLVGEFDLIARFGGDEFVILKPLGSSALNISGLADQIVEAMQKPFVFDGKTTSCSASVGVAIANARMEFPEQVVADADTALYHAKENGRGRWSFFTAEMHADSIATKNLVSDLLIACEERAFTPFFQPLIEAKTGQIASAEVLVRWAHPTRGLLPPAAFLETAAHMGILKQVDAIMFGHLQAALTFFDTSGVHLPSVGVNVSAGRLADPSFIHDIKTSGISPARLTVEILESVYLERMPDVVRWAIDELKDLGVTIAIDDFGTGHASVQGLVKIQPSVLKIDRSFIQPVVHDETASALAASIIGIGKSLGMRIVAEGVETEDHAHVARDMGCDLLQGYFFGKPMCAHDLRARLVETQGQFWRPDAPCLGMVRPMRDASVR